MKFGRQQVLSFNQKALELITIQGGSLTITRENPLRVEYLIKLPEATQNDISQQTRLMDVLGSDSQKQMMLSGIKDMVSACTLPFLPMPSGSGTLARSPNVSTAQGDPMDLSNIENDELNVVIDGKIQCQRCLGFGHIARLCCTPSTDNRTAQFKPLGGHEGGCEGLQKQRQQSYQSTPAQQSQHHTGQPSYRTGANQPNWRVLPKRVNNVDDPEVRSGHPPTKEREAARLYLTNLNVIQKDIINKSDLLRFYAKVQTSHSKTRSAYTLMDPGASHCCINTAFAKHLGLHFGHAGHMSIITAGTKHPPEDRYQVWLNGKIYGITGNYTDVTGWYTVFDLKGAYNIIIGKNWHSKTCYLVDSDNVLHLLEGDWSLLTDGRPVFVSKLVLKVLRPHQAHYREVHNHCAAMAKAASINLISAHETKCAISRFSGDRIFVIDIWECRMGDEFGEDDSFLADLGKSRVQIRCDFDDLFLAPSGVPPPGEHDFHIHTDPTAKIPHRQPYRMTQSERNEFQVQIKKLLEKGWVMDSHSRYIRKKLKIYPCTSVTPVCVRYSGTFPSSGKLPLLR